MVNSSDINSYDVSQALKTENLTNNDYQEICERLGREPNRTELGMFGVMWSEHCCYRIQNLYLLSFLLKVSLFLLVQVKMQALLMLAGIKN